MKKVIIFLNCRCPFCFMNKHHCTHSIDICIYMCFGENRNWVRDLSLTLQRLCKSWNNFYRPFEGVLVLSITTSFFDDSWIMYASIADVFHNVSMIWIIANIFTHRLLTFLAPVLRKIDEKNGEENYWYQGTA